MIVTQIKGGLGNQMFQYAVGYALSIQNKDNLLLDTSYYSRQDKANNEDFQKRKFELDVFSFEYDIADEILTSRLRSSSTGILERILGRGFKTVIQEGDYVDPKLLIVDGNVYLNGYWQSESYFLGHGNKIARQFKWKHEATGKDLEIINKIEAEPNSVCLHVRRSDYVTSKNANKAHGLMGLEYYNTAISKLIKTHPDVSFYIFSDDPEWTRTNIKVQGKPVVYVTHNPIEKGYEDMRIMKSCKHFIIANSTFSWWAAWLAEHQQPRADRIVYAPARWFNDLSRNSENIIPDRWLKI